MTFLGLPLARRKPEGGPDPETEAAMRARLAGRVKSVDQKRRLRDFGTIRGASRRHDREASYRVATAMFAPDELSSCRVVNQSHSGLRLSFHSDVVCPDEFALTIPTLRFIGIVRKVWQSGCDAGVSIVRWSDCA